MGANVSIITTGFHIVSNPQKPNWQNKMAQKTKTQCTLKTCQKQTQIGRQQVTKTVRKTQLSIHVHDDNQCQQKLQQRHGFLEMKKRK